MNNGPNLLIILMLLAHGCWLTDMTGTVSRAASSNLIIKLSYYFATHNMDIELAGNALASLTQDVKDNDITNHVID